MPFDWKSCVALARRLAGEAADNDDAEALQRSAVSRAYFGVFGYARNYAISYLKFQTRDLSEDHGRLRKHLWDRKRQGDAKRLERLRQWRNEADYLDELPWDNLPKTLESVLSDAELVFKSLAPPKSK